MKTKKYKRLPQWNDANIDAVRNAQYIMERIEDHIYDIVSIRDGYIVIDDVEIDAVELMQKHYPQAYKNMMLDMAYIYNIDDDEIDWDYVDEKLGLSDDETL